MITAIDTSILVDVFLPDPTFGPASREALRRCESEGRLIACEVVWAELAAGAPSRARLEGDLRTLGVAFSPLDEQAALTAGEVQRRYRARGGRQPRVVADFLVAAHALHHADRLLTRDRGFYRSYFRRLAILDPTRP